MKTHDWKLMNRPRSGANTETNKQWNQKPKKRWTHLSTWR